jgi:hypothetical protein
VVDKSPIKVNAKDELIDFTNIRKPSYDVTVDVYQDN